MAEDLAPDARVLVIHVARIGDTLLITPALRALKERFSQGRLIVLAHPQRRALLEGLPFIDALGSVTPKNVWWRGRFSNNQYDYAIVYGHDAPLVRYAARLTSRVVGFEQKEAAINALLWRAVPAPETLIHAVHERLLLTQALGAQTTDHRLAYAVHDSERRAVKRWLGQRLPHGPRPLIGFQVASFPTKAYRDWPLESFAELGRRILATKPEAHILILGGGESRTTAARLAGQLGRATAIAGQFNLRQTAALMEQLHLYVGVDTGPTHLAGALRVPLVALYHCRHRGRHLAPLQHERLRILEHPASDTDCSVSSPMSEISVDAVWAEVRALLS